MKYFIDTEFHEHKRKPFLSKAVDTIELISIGIVSEDGREYYAISKDFDIDAAWENEWLRKNVLKDIFSELYKPEKKEIDQNSPKFLLGRQVYEYLLKMENRYYFDNISSVSVFKSLIEKHGKTNKQIAKEIKDFTSYRTIESVSANKTSGEIKKVNLSPLSFYGYYSDYDWVVFCWLFGRMIDLPEGFPMYCIDLNQTLNEKGGEALKSHTLYPKQINEHNALEDAKWNKELYRFLISLA